MSSEETPEKYTTEPKGSEENKRFVRGPFQSPINISTKEARNIDLPALKWSNYGLLPKKVKLTNNGHTVVMSGKWHQVRPFIDGGPLSGKYVFSQLHFHWGKFDDEGSEHTIDGECFPMEMHVVHFKSIYRTQEAALRQKDGVCVLTILFKVQPTLASNIQTIVDILPWIREPNKSLEIAPFPLSSLMQPFENKYYLYWGSLAAPPCTQLILWFVSQNYNGISTSQLEEFRALSSIHGGLLQRNFRPVQPLNGRTIFNIIQATTYETRSLAMIEQKRADRLLLLEEFASEVLTAPISPETSSCCTSTSESRESLASAESLSAINEPRVKKTRRGGHEIPKAPIQKIQPQAVYTVSHEQVGGMLAPLKVLTYKDYRENDPVEKSYCPTKSETTSKESMDVTVVERDSKLLHSSVPPVKAGVSTKAKHLDGPTDVSVLYSNTNRDKIAVSETTHFRVEGGIKKEIQKTSIHLPPHANDQCSLPDGTSDVSGYETESTIVSIKHRPHDTKHPTEIAIRSRDQAGKKMTIYPAQKAEKGAKKQSTEKGAEKQSPQAKEVEPDTEETLVKILEAEQLNSEQIPRDSHSKTSSKTTRTRMSLYPISEWSRLQLIAVGPSQVQHQFTQTEFEYFRKAKTRNKVLSSCLACFRKKQQPQNPQVLETKESQTKDENQQGSFTANKDAALVPGASNTTSILLNSFTLLPEKTSLNAPTEKDNISNHHSKINDSHVSHDKASTGSTKSHSSGTASKIKDLPMTHDDKASIGTTNSHRSGTASKMKDPPMTHDDKASIGNTKSYLSGNSYQINVTNMSRDDKTSIGTTKSQRSSGNKRKHKYTSMSFADVATQTKKRFWFQFCR